MSAVQVIPAKLNFHTRIANNIVTKRKVAGYARVSTDQEEQYTSYAAQIDYYTKYIKRNPEWDFVEVYTDEGISGTNTKHREGFNKMIADALSGKIDLIVTKSVSRFARNTVDSLTTIRKLKEYGTEVYFEKENIWTFDSKGELLITIMSSLAQEESRSISENVTWGHRKRFADGKVSLPYKRFLGYKKGTDGLPEIVEEEAVIVRRIYDLFIIGKPIKAIAEILTEEHIPTPSGKEKWNASTIQSILTNEKYKGSALLQKGFTVDFLTKKRKVNEGEVPQYYVEKSHPAIIEPHLWDLTQLELKRRKDIGRSYCGNSFFSSRLICEKCGCYYGRRDWQTKSSGKQYVWRCNHKYNKSEKCDSPIIKEEDIKKKFIEVMNEIFTDREIVLERCGRIYDSLNDTSNLDVRISLLNEECGLLSEMSKNLIAESQSTTDQNEFMNKYSSFITKYDETKIELDTLIEQKHNQTKKANQLSAFMFELHERDSFITNFDEKLWITTIDSVKVRHDGTLIFKLKNGKEILK